MNTKEDTFDFQILQLTNAFYNAYPNPPYTEILSKPARSYHCLLIQSHYDYFICIPYRSEITHKYAYMFTHSKRSVKHKSGLDYSKIVIIKNPLYLNTSDSIIDQDEYVETRSHLLRIKKEAQSFVDTYIYHISEQNILHPREFSRRYQFSPLKYFHCELGIKL